MPELKHEHSVVIHAPPEEIYRYIADFRQHTEWNYQPQEIEKISDGPVGVGTVFRTVEELPRDFNWVMRKILFPVFNLLIGSSGKTMAEITAMEPGRRLTWTSWMPIRGGKRAMEVYWEILLQPQNGATLVTQRSHWVPKHKMANPSGMSDTIHREIEANLNQLKEHLERQQKPRNHMAGVS